MQVDLNSKREIAFPKTLPMKKLNRKDHDSFKSKRIDITGSGYRDARFAA